MDMAVKLAKEGGKFVLNGKEVSSDEAIKVLKNVDDIATIDITNQDGKETMKINLK